MVILAQAVVTPTGLEQTESSPCRVHNLGLNSLTPFSMWLSYTARAVFPVLRGRRLVSR